MAATTRERLIDAARRQFAARGFYGTSIASIAADLGLSKQALLHHFGSKETLYGEVLAAIATRMLGQALDTRGDGPVAELEAALAARVGSTADDVQDAQLIMRELLDNAPRAEGAARWYLKPWLEQLVRTVQRIPGEEGLDDAEALATVYQLLGAANYLTVSGPTLTQMFGAETHSAMQTVYPEVLRRLVRARFAAGG